MIINHSLLKFFFTIWFVLSEGTHSEIPSKESWQDKPSPLTKQWFATARKFGTPLKGIQKCCFNETIAGGDSFPELVFHSWICVVRKKCPHSNCVDVSELEFWETIEVCYNRNRKKNATINCLLFLWRGEMVLSEQEEASEQGLISWHISSLLCLWPEKASTVLLTYEEATTQVVNWLHLLSWAWIQLWPGTKRT